MGHLETFKVFHYNLFLSSYQTYVGFSLENYKNLLSRSSTSISRAEIINVSYTSLFQSLNVSILFAKQNQSRKIEETRKNEQKWAFSEKARILISKFYILGLRNGPFCYY